MSALHVDDRSFGLAVLKSELPVLVDFWAPWCGPCRAMGGAVDELAKELAGEARVVKVNVDDAPQTAVQYRIQSIPTFAVFHQGELRERFSGVVNKGRLRAALEPVLHTPTAD